MEKVLLDVIFVVILLNLFFTGFGIFMIIGISSTLVKIADLLSATPKKRNRDRGLVDLEARTAENWGEDTEEL